MYSDKESDRSCAPQLALVLTIAPIQEVVAHPRLPILAWADGEIPGAGVIVCRMADGIGSFNPFSSYTSLHAEATIEAAACDAGAWGRHLEGRTVTALCWGCCHTLFAATRGAIRLLRLSGDRSIVAPSCRQPLAVSTASRSAD